MYSDQNTHFLHKIETFFVRHLSENNAVLKETAWAPIEIKSQRLLPIAETAWKRIISIAIITDVIVNYSKIRWKEKSQTFSIHHWRSWTEVNQFVYWIIKGVFRTLNENDYIIHSRPLPLPKKKRERDRNPTMFRTKEN